MNTLIAGSTLPIGLGFGLVAPNAAALLNPLLVKGGALAPIVGTFIGTGPGRGIGFMYLQFGVAIVATTLIAMRVPALARFDREVPDAIADDLVGLQVLDTLRLLLERHESLRTTFAGTAEGPVQQVASSGELTVRLAQVGQERPLQLAEQLAEELAARSSRTRTNGHCAA